jgi:hypothetical protein
MKTGVHFSSYLAHLFLEWEMVQTKVAEKIKTYFMFSNFFFFFFCNRAFYEIMWKLFVEPGRPQLTNCACALHAEYVRLETRNM